MNYRPEIDGLRALAVISVMLFHAGFQTFSGGFIGVDIFFVISGYLITSIILSEKKASTFTLINFYERRARRILPALFLIIFACSLFAWFSMLPSDMKEFSDSIFAVFTFISNILFWKTNGYFDTSTELKPLLHTWSLAVEEQYYLLFPIFLIVTWKFGKRWILTLLTLILIISLAAAQWGSNSHREATFYLLPTRGWELLIGSLVAFYFSNRITTNFDTSLRQMGSIFGLLLITYAIFVFDKYTPFPSLHTLAPTIGTALIILFADQQTMVGKLLSNKLFVGIGLISYSAYLWHQPLFAFARLGNESEQGKVILGTLVITALALAYFSWKYVEIPFRDKQRFSRKKIFTLSAIFSAFFIIFGMVGNLTKGFVFRYPVEDRYLASLQKCVAGIYVQTRFNKLSMKPFNISDSRKKILIIGDSYGQDLVNALYEANFTRHLQLSTRHISAQCGNLFIEYDKIIPNIIKTSLDLCRVMLESGVWKNKLGGVSC